MGIENKVREVLFTKEMLAQRIAELGKQITEDYRDKDLLVISLLKGSFIFAADLVRSIELPTRIEFMTTSMYGHSETNTGVLKVLTDVDADLTQFDVLVVDDITDSALTMTSVLRILQERNPKSLKACVLLDKPSRRRVAYNADYVGFEIPDKFIVGFGLNYGDYFRNENHIFAFVDKENE